MRTARILLPLLAAAALVAACTDSTGGAGSSSSPTTTPTAAPSVTAPPTEGPVGVFDLSLGVCLTDATVSGSADEVELVTCDGPHRGEVYAVVEIPVDEFLGDDEIARVAENACYVEYEAFVGLPLEDSVHDFVYLHPTSESWEEIDDREVTCIAVSAEERTGSLRGVAE